MRPFVLSGLVGLIFILIQPLIWQGAMWVIEPEANARLSTRASTSVF